MKARIGYSFLAFMFVGLNCFAQDPTFSQYNLNQYYYNPAYTGDHGGYQVAATCRTLWPNVPGKIVPGALSTTYAFADAYLQRGTGYTAGAGVFAMQDVEGEGFLTTSTIGLSYAQHFPIIGQKGDALPRLQISLGFKAYFNSISVNWDKLVFSDQLNIDEGIIGQSAADHNGIGHKYTGDLDAGLLVKNNAGGKDRWYNELGFAMAHILTPSISLTNTPGENGRLPRKYVGSYRTSIRLEDKRFYLGPTILFENQARFYELNSGLDFFINPRPDNPVIPFCISVLNRFSTWQTTGSTNAVIAAVRYKGLMGKRIKVIYNIGFAADFPYTGLLIQSKGAYELSLGMIFPRKGNDHYSKCPYETY